MSQVTKPILLDETGQAIVGKLQSIAEAIGTDAVRFTEQVLTEAQKAQARQNIDAPSTDDIPDISGLATKTELATKQDAISDLSTIRTGAGLGATALQPSDLNPYRTASAQDAIDNGKVDKVTGKGLSTNDYTTTEKQKLAGIAEGATKVQDNHVTANGTILINGSSVIVYDDEDIRQALAGFEKGYVIASESAITGTKDATTGNWNNVTAITGVDLSALKVGDNVYLLDDSQPDFWVSQVTPSVTLNVLDTKTDLNNYYTKAEIASLLNGKQDTISDLSTIRSNATAGKDASDTIDGYGNVVTHNVSEFATAAQGAKADSALQEHQSLAAYRTSAQQDVIDAGKEDSTNKVTAISSSSTDVQYPSAKAVYDAIQPKPIASSIPTGGMLPDVMYALGTISADPNVTISNPSDGKDHEWMLTFSIGATAPASVTFPSNVVFPDTATFEANKHYEVSMKWDANDSKYYGLIQVW